MNKMRCVLCSLNEFDFTDRLDDDCLEKRDGVKGLLVREFEDYDVPKMIYALNILDELKLSYVTNDLDYHLKRTETLRSVIFCLISFKHVADTDNNQEDKKLFGYSFVFLFNHFIISAK